MTADPGKRALIVDDDEPIRLMLAKVISRAGLEVDSARDGVEALESMERNDYDVIILDLMMPRLDGYGVLQYLEEHRPELLPRIIIASAVSEGEIARKLHSSVFRIHAKPFDISHLLADIAACSGA